MTDVLAHRGPDSSGIWTDPSAGVGLGHRRLAIQDLSSAGAQPMASACGRYVVTYNGEIFNAPDLRRELEAKGERFRGTSDTEAMLACFTRHGVNEALKLFVGQFAFALWDRKEKTLTLVRDRLGLKPLYWFHDGGLTLFGSELKALMRHPDFTRNIDRQAVAAYLRYAYVPSPMSIFARTEKVPPGGLVRIHADGRTEREIWWDLARIAARGLSSPRDVDAQTAADEAEKLLRDAVKKRLLSDVPLGALLSGGIDSSLVVALMQSQSSRPVRTFSIGFAETGYNEAADAAAVARHLGTDHTELILTPDDALAAVPALAEMYDEPFADSSQIPTHLVSVLARKSVTVALSGDGGDEIAAGYHRHAYIGNLWPRLKNIPGPLRHAAAAAIGSVPSRAWNSMSSALPARRRPRLAADKASKFAALIGADSANQAYRELVTHWSIAERLLPGTTRAETIADDDMGMARIENALGRMQYLDMAMYLPDDILCKVDRASMAVALEVRCPLLDHNVVEFFWELPRSLLARSNKGKLLLRQILARHVPEELFERPKMGFGVPIEFWLRGPLREWAEELLDEDRLKREGIFDPAPIRQVWREHLSGRADHQYRLWTILMFQAWHERWMKTF